MTEHAPRIRYFTPDEANELLPELNAQLARCRELVESEQRDEAQAIIEALSAQGIEVKGIEPALLDFPAIRNGQEVFLCWRQGESQVEAWHPMSTGFAGRRPLDPGEAGAWEWCN